MAETIFTIIVADDEEELRQAVCSMIPWEEIGFRLVGSAGNGLDALQLVEQLQPDLLLTDIQMPFITGTALARQVRELQPLIQVAFLSGYDDFEYAQSAIDNDVIAYLLKPISMAELSAALREIHGKMEARFQELRGAGGQGSALHATVAALLLDTLAEHGSEQTLQRQLNDSGMVFTEPYALTVLSIGLPGAALQGQEAAQTVDKALRKYYSCCSVSSGKRVLTLLAAEDGLTRLGQALDELYYVVRRLLDEGAVIGVSRPYGQLRSSFIACREAVDAQRFARESGIHHISDLQADMDAGFWNEQEYLEKLERLLYNGSRTELERHLRTVLSAGGELPAESRIAALQTLVTARNVLTANESKEDAALLLRRCGLEDPFAAQADPQGFARQVTDLCLRCQERLARRKNQGLSSLCERALREIEQNYTDETLSLSSVSETLQVSPNYLSANMKKYAGDTFMNLLIQKRMEAAKSLLTEGGMKIAEIAERCGYSDQHYFSFCFKKYYGVSPARMRRGEGGEESA